jgi:hypothetical protein
MRARSSNEPTPNPPDRMLPASTAHPTWALMSRTATELQGDPELRREVMAGLMRSLDEQLDPGLSTKNSLLE